ncbi:MAG: protein kinase [Vicinamibacterales bacterium]
MADATSPPPDGEDDRAQPGASRGGRPTVPAGFPSGPGGTRHGNSPTIGSGFGPGPSGTAHSTGPKIASGFGMPPGLGPNLSPGSSVTLNGEAYVVERLISTSTGEADIYLLRQGDQPSVLKLYYPNYQPKADVLAPLKQLRHDDILNLIDYGHFQGRFFEVMEYAAGGTVEQYLPLRDPQQLRALIAECVNAFRFCHDRGIVHKDIKPGNLFYKRPGQTDLAIGDFGISSMLAAGVSRHLTSQSLTVGYAAPEMYGVGINGEVKVYVGREVDYYALGVTLIHLWAGRSPFEGLGMHAIANLTITGAITVPADLPKDLQTLVRGLITIDFTHRWGFAEVQRWLKGEDVPVHVQAAPPAFPPFKFGVRDEAATPEALVVLLKANPESGKKSLYSGKISAWVNVFNHARASTLDTIIEDDYPQAQDAGLQKAIYVLDPDQPYEGDKRQCRTTQELAAALEDGSSFYGPLLKNPHHAFYLYLEAHGAKQEADTFRSYFQTFSAKKALNATILALAGKASVTILGREFTSPEDVLAARGQSAVVDSLKDRESRLSLWMERAATTTVLARLEAWRALQVCDATTLAYVSDSADGVPKLELSPTRVSFSDLRPRSMSGGSFDIRNLGEGRLTGSISVDKPWLALTTTTIDPGQKTQPVAFSIDTSAFPFGATDSATVKVCTNVGTQTVTVAIVIEQGIKAVARFRNLATASAAAVGAVLGLAIHSVSALVGTTTPWALAGLLGVVGLAMHVGSAERKGRKVPLQPGLMALATGLALWAFLLFRPPLLSSPSGWSLLFAVIVYALAPRLLATVQTTSSRSAVPFALLASAGVICAGVILGDRQLADLIGKGKAGLARLGGAALAPRAGLLSGTEPPEQIVDRGACPYELCTYGERLVATEDVAAYTAPPQTLGVAPDALQKLMIIPRGTWITTVTGLVIAKRHEGRVVLPATHYNGSNGPPLTNGQVVAAYTYLGEGCESSWIDGKLYVICSLETDPKSATQEWWVQIVTADGTRAWVLPKALVSQEDLNSSLGQAVEDAKSTLESKLLKMDLLLKEGADLNGDGGRYGTTPVEAVIRSKDVALLRELLSRGLDLRKACPAITASQSALEPGGVVMLEALLESGMQLGCLQEPPLLAFLRIGTRMNEYPVDRAIEVAEVLVKHGALVNQQDSKGRSILDSLDVETWAAHVAPLRAALVASGTAQN